MRLKKFEIHNFKGIQSASFEWEDIIILIGENNAGKSSVLEALQCFLGGSIVKDENLFCEHQIDAAHAIELIGYFDQLTADEEAAAAVRGRMNGNEWVIKKRFWAETETPESTERSWKELYYSYSVSEKFIGWPENEASWTNFPSDYQPLIAQLGAVRSNQTTRKQLEELIRQNKPELIDRSVAGWLENPGGGGNWKSNANSIIPRFIIVKAVHDASSETISKEASAYGRILSLIVEKKMMQRPEVVALKEQIEKVLQLFRPDPQHPELQADEIKDAERRINDRLQEVVGGIVSIETIEPDIKPVLLPSTILTMKDSPDAVSTSIAHQGHGLQRTLIMTLLQILAEIQIEIDVTDTRAAGGTPNNRSTILAVEEPELYMHPQMERKMRDVLYRLADQDGLQVVCTTHSPVFLDIAQKHKAIVRVIKDGTRNVSFLQVTAELFSSPPSGEDEERERLQIILRFNPFVNEVFFAKRVVLLEEQSAIAAFEIAAELSGLFFRYPNTKRDTILIDASGKYQIPIYQKVLNHFQIQYTVVFDEDSGNLNVTRINNKITALLSGTSNKSYLISPTDLEELLGYSATGDKTYQAFKRVKELHSTTGFPDAFVKAMNFVYFGEETEPTAGL